ncbi:MAG: ATP-binding cassette domain-containing protein [Candidatus Nitrosocosmicus sp.]|nr:ATP-binding cassette domain-containing protein [Candidatus Nitrosocosmicus sp.]
MGNLDNTLKSSIKDEIDDISEYTKTKAEPDTITTTGDGTSHSIKAETERSLDSEFKIENPKLSVQSLKAWFSGKLALKGINLDVKENCVTALIGPSGCGKTTLLRCINRMHDLTPNATADGKIILDNINIYDKQTDPVLIKRRMGMVFQKPNKKRLTVIIVTHNMQQAARVSDYTAFMYLGELIEFGPTDQIFKYPKKELTERYISGKFG